MQTRFRLIAPAALLLVGLAACGSGAAQTPSAPAANQKAPAAQTQAQGGKKKEEPLTGDLKTKAEQAALAKYPGTVLKSEHDAEKPGMYAVEIKQATGKTVEVYLDKTYKVTGTKDEGQDKGSQGDGDGD